MLSAVAVVIPEHRMIVENQAGRLWPGIRLEKHCRGKAGYASAHHNAVKHLICVYRVRRK